MKRFIRADARAGGGGEGKHFLWGKKKPSGGTFGGLARVRLRARVTRKRKRGFPPAPRGAGGAGRASRARAPPPSPRSRPSGRPRRGSRPPRPPGPPSTRGGRRREVGARRFVQSDTSRLPRWHPFLFFLPRRARDERAAGREGEGDGRRVRRARGASRRRVPSVAPLARDLRRAPRGSALEARLASASLGATAEGVGGFASPPILRARASEEPFLPAGPRRAPPPPPRPRRPRARVCSACALALARVRRAVRVARPLASARAGAQCARGRARCSHHASNALLPFPRRVVPFRSFTTTGARVRASAGAARGRKSYGAQSGTFAYRPRQRGSANPQISRRRPSRRFRLRSGPR